MAIHLRFDWRDAWRWFSVQAMVIAAALVLAWQAVPDDLRAAAPSWLTTAVLVLILALGVLGRVIQQTPPPSTKSELGK